MLCTSSVCVLPDICSHCYTATGKCHCWLRCLEEGCHATYRSFCLPYPDRTNSSLLGMQPQPSAQPPQAQQLFQRMTTRTLRPISCGALPFPFHVHFMPVQSFIWDCLLALVLRPSFCAALSLLICLFFSFVPIFSYTSRLSSFSIQSCFSHQNQTLLYNNVDIGY